MYMIAILRESPPHSEFVAYAAKENTPVQTHARIPESPIYCRPSGFKTITSSNCPSPETWDLLNTLRELSQQFFILHTPNHQHQSPLTSHNTSSHHILSLHDRIFTLPPSHSDTLTFPDLHSRSTYEGLRLTALLYAHALATRTPFSTASADLISGTATTTSGTWPPGLSSTEALHVQIRNALLATDCSSVWGPLAGVLFWIALVAGAGADPGPLANEERVGVEEDGRKYLAAIAVRCSIVLSFEHGESVLKMLRRLVRVGNVLNRVEQVRGEAGSDDGEVWRRFGGTAEVTRETWAQGSWTSEPGIGTLFDGFEVAGPEPPPLQKRLDDWTQMADFAWDFDGMG